MQPHRPSRGSQLSKLQGVELQGMSGQLALSILTGPFESGVGPFWIAACIDHERNQIERYCLHSAPLVQPLTIAPAGARARDHINYGYCSGSLRLMNDVSRCRKPAADSGQCPPGQIARGGLTWAYHFLCCPDPDKPSACKGSGRIS